MILNLISTAASAQSTHMYKGSHEASVEMTEFVDRLFILPKRIFWVVYLTCQILRHEKKRYDASEQANITICKLYKYIYFHSETFIQYTNTICKRK